MCFTIQNAIINCITTMKINFIIKEVLEILCLKNNIAQNKPNVPPIKEIANNLFSEIRVFFILADCLSYAVIKNAKILKSTKAIIKIFILLIELIELK